MGPISELLRLRATQFLLQRWRTVGNSVTDLNHRPPAKAERVNTRPIGHVNFNNGKLPELAGCFSTFIQIAENR